MILATINWETLGVMLAIIALGVPTLNKINRVATLLAILTERVDMQNVKGSDEHMDFRACIKQHGITLSDHEQRIGKLEKDR